MLYQRLRSNAITLKSYRKSKIEHQLIIRDWSVEQKRESREREKGLSCYSPPSVWPSDSSLGQQTLFPMICLSFVFLRVVFTRAKLKSFVLQNMDFM